MDCISLGKNWQNFCYFQLLYVIETLNYIRLEIIFAWILLNIHCIKNIVKKDLLLSFMFHVAYICFVQWAISYKSPFSASCIARYVCY